VTKVVSCTIVRQEPRSRPEQRPVTNTWLILVP